MSMPFQPLPCPAGSGGGGPIIVDPGLDVEDALLCDVLADGTVAGVALLEVVYDAATGLRTGTRTVNPTTGAPYVPTGTLQPCPSSGTVDQPCAATVTVCRCDDTDADGIADTTYTELWCIPSDGTAPTLLLTYTGDDPSTVYTPVAPLDCDAGTTPLPQVTGVRAFRTVLAPGTSWSLTSGAGPAPQSVTATALDDADASVTTQSGTSTLAAGESVTWSVIKDHDHVLHPPLIITAGAGRVAVSWTEEVST